MHTSYRASSGRCVCSGVCVTSGSTPLLVSPRVAPDTSMAPLPGSPLPATPSWHTLPSPYIWSSQVSASPATLACPALPSLRRGAAARLSSLLLISLEDYSPADSAHGRLRERFHVDLPVLRLHSYRGGDFCSDLLRDFCRGEGILHSFTLPASPQQNGIAERRIGLVMEPCVSFPETSPTLLWTVKVDDASVFWVWVLRPRLVPCLPLLGHPLLGHHVSSPRAVPFYRLFPYRSTPPLPPPLFLAPDPLLGTAPIEVVVGLGAARRAASGGAETGVAESEGAGSRGAEPGDEEPGGVELGGAESEGAESGVSRPFVVEDCVAHLPPFYVIVYVDDLVFATADSEALTLVKVEQQKRHTCTDLAPPSDESIEPSGPYLELMGCLMYLMTCTRPDLAYPLCLLARNMAPVRQAWGLCLEDGFLLSSLVTQTLLGSSCEAEIYARAMAAQELCWLTYLLTDLGEQPCSTLQRGQLRHAYMTTRANTADILTKALLPGDHQRFSNVLDVVKKVQQPQQPHGEVLAGADATAAWAKASSRSGQADWETWHERLCHVNFSMLQNSGTGPAKARLALVHMDVVCPTRAPSLSGSRYFLTIVDDHTRAVWVYPLKTKGEVAAAVLKEWMPRAQRESRHKVKVIRTDNGGEFIGADFEAVLKKKGIQHQLTEGARTLLGHGGLPDLFWVTALRQLALLKNRVLATVGDKQWLPYTKWYGSAPAVNMLRAYGCMMVFHVPKEKRRELEASRRWGVHLGLTKDHKGWLIWDLTSQQLTVSRDANEVQRPSRQVQVTVSHEEISEVTEDGGEPEVEEEQQQQQQQQQHQQQQLQQDAPPRTQQELYMLQPEGLDDGSGRVCRLKKDIYGLKQAPRPWHHKLEETLLAGGFKKSEYDLSLFLLQEKEQFLMLMVYVDNILLFSESFAMIERLEEMLEMQFKCLKMGDVRFYLGMHVERDLDKGVLRLHHRKYCEGLAEKYGLQDGGKPATPLPSGFSVEPYVDEEVVGGSDSNLFHSMVGALNYAANHTRPDIAFVTSRLASVVSRPSHEQLEVAKRLVRFVSATASVGLEYSAVRQRQQRGAADFGKGEMLLTCYTDASFNSVNA
ncbi:unnamed protein product [Closterium sp. NIES-53]